MALQTPVLTKTFPLDTAVAINSVVVASATAGNAKLPAAAGATGIIGVTAETGDGRDSKYYGAVTQLGVVQCRTLTGTAIAVGDFVKIADTSGRVTKLTPAAAGAGTLKGVVGIAQEAVGSGAATDTQIGVLLTPGMALYE